MPPDPLEAALVCVCVCVCVSPPPPLKKSCMQPCTWSRTQLRGMSLHAFTNAFARGSERDCTQLQFQVRSSYTVDVKKNFPCSTGSRSK